MQWDEKERLAFDFARRAADLDSTDAMVEIVLGRITLYRRRFDEADRHVERALALNPNDADVLAHAAPCRAYLGDGASGVELAARAARLNPVSGDWYIGPMALSLFVLGRYEESMDTPSGCPTRPSIVRRCWPQRWPSPATPTGGALRDRFLREFQESVTFGRRPDPGEPLRWLLHVSPFRRAADIERVTTGLSLAGLPVDPDTIACAAVHRQRSGLARFRRERPVDLVFDGPVVISDAKGLRDLASLLANPGEEHHCLELAGRPAETGGRMRSSTSVPSANTARDSKTCRRKSTRRIAITISPAAVGPEKRWTPWWTRCRARSVSAAGRGLWAAPPNVPGPRSRGACGALKKIAPCTRAGPPPRQ